MEHTCRNCAADFNGKFCYNCGQKFSVPRFSFKHILEELFHAFTHADKSFLSYGWHLLLQPGKVSYEYIIERKRKKYFNPFTFFLLILAISLFFDNWQLRLSEELYHPNNEYGRLFNVYGKALMFALIPLSAFTFWLFAARKARPLYAEFTVFAMMVTSAYLILNVFLTVADCTSMLALHRTLNLTNNIVYLLLMVSYITYAHLDFQKRNGAIAIAGSVLSGVFYFGLVLLVQVFVIWAFIRGFQGVGNFEAYGFHFGY